MRPRLRVVALGVIAICLLMFAALKQAWGAQTELVIEVANARFISISGTGVDPGPDLDAATTADNDTVGPYFLVKGDIVSVNGQPKQGTFLCRGVVLTDASSPMFGEPGVGGRSQVDQTFEIEDEGIIFGSRVELNDDEPAGAITGGTGEFAGLSGEYQAVGGAFPLADGRITFTFFINTR